MNQYKFHSRVAAEVCKAHPELKTKVVINRGDTKPSIAIKHRDENSYRRIPDDLFEPANEEVNRRTKMETEKRKKDKEEKALLGITQMDIGAPAAGN